MTQDDGHGKANVTIDDLRTIVGDGGLVDGESLYMRSCDPFRHVAPSGCALVRPADTLELSQVMKLCTQRRQPVVVHGGCTGVAGGAYVDPDEIAVSLERMSAVEKIDPIGGYAIVQAGCTLQALDDALAGTGLFFPVDLGARGSATIGGMLATNAGGVRVIRWGMMRANVLGLEAVLANGSVVGPLNTYLKNNTGYDLKHLFIGSEGTLGIITRAVLRLAPVPASRAVAFLSVPGFQELLALMVRARQLSSLSAFEVLWRDFYEMVAQDGGDRRPVAPDQPYYVLMETMGSDPARDDAVLDEFLEEVVAKGYCVDGVLGKSGREISALWRVREASDVVSREMSPFESFDVSIEISDAEAFVVAARRSLEQRFGNVRLATFGHLADNNIHIGVHVSGQTTETERDIAEVVYRTLADRGGKLTAEHGIGRVKKPFLKWFRTPEELESMRVLKNAFDPDGLLNRGVMFQGRDTGDTNGSETARNRS